MIPRIFTLAYPGTRTPPVINKEPVFPSEFITHFQYPLRLIGRAMPAGIFFISLSISILHQIIAILIESGTIIADKQAGRSSDRLGLTIQNEKNRRLVLLMDSKRVKD